ncbi:MAG TPA: alpha/beta fold hydrolase [Kofleriaceae bacterium]|nr:alpha/beta fold hydrolase [Kofleriaceae bacterium]
MRLRTAGLTIIAAFAALHARRADACSFHGTVTPVTYWDATSTYNPAVANDSRCTPSGSGQTCRLKGYYITPSPAPTGPAPTVIFIHGTGQGMPGGYCETINAFVDRGYVVFAPVMRGVSGSAPPAASFTTNTGSYVVDYGTANATSTCGVACQSLKYMNKETLDIDSAIHWLIANHPTTFDLSRLALVGHSYGGATVTIAAASTSKLTYVPTVTVSLSGAAMSWSAGSDWEDGLNDPADNARSPMYFQRVINESPIAPDINSALEPYDHVVWAGGAARLASYGWYTPSTTQCNDFPYHNVHCGFVGEPEGVAIWIDGVIEFFRDYGVK